VAFIRIEKDIGGVFIVQLGHAVVKVLHQPQHGSRVLCQLYRVTIGAGQIDAFLHQLVGRSRVVVVALFNASCHQCRKHSNP